MLQGDTKNCQLVAVVPKAHVRTNVCAHRKSIKLCNFQKCFGGFLCSCAPMFKFFCMPPDGASTEYQISNREFSDFLRTYYCDFLSNVYKQAKFFSVVIMGNVTHILPVLHCLKRGIAFVSSVLVSSLSK